jgi:HTH-type transcriptional repressor of NAD biosynthesis genes
VRIHPLEPLAWYGEGYRYVPDPEPTPAKPAEPDANARPEWKSEVKGKRGLVCGRFLPLHRGHQFLIDFARARCKKLVIAVHKDQHDCIPQAVRIGWLRELYPGCQVIGDSRFGSIDMVFSSEAAHQQLATELGARLVLCDPQRTVVPISATRIRETPLLHWRYLPECVRPYYLKVVRLVGPEGSGKTSLCQRLANRFDTCFVPEYAVTLAATNGGKLKKEQLAEWGQQHLAVRHGLERLANRILFLDTDLLTVAHWGERLWGEAPPWIRKRRVTYDLTMILEPVLDGLNPEQVRERQEMYEKWSGVEGVRLGGNWSEREAQAVAAVGQRWSELL